MKIVIYNGKYKPNKIHIMRKSEKKDKKAAMDALNIPVAIRSAFMRWANKWGRFNIYGDWKWYEYSPLEQRSKCSMTMEEMWKGYKNRHSA